MIHIVNHPYLADLESQVRWEDSGKFIALGEIFENIGLTETDSVGQNKVNLSLFRSSSLQEKKPPSTSSNDT
jgi:hypothetical protein